MRGVPVILSEIELAADVQRLQVLLPHRSRDKSIIEFESKSPSSLV